MNVKVNQSIGREDCVSSKAHSNINNFDKHGALILLFVSAYIIVSSMLTI